MKSDARSILDELDLRANLLSTPTGSHAKRLPVKLQQVPHTTIHA